MLTSQENARRRELYDLGLSDGEIAKKISRSREAIQYWRTYNNLPPNYNQPASTKGIRMERALTPDQCEETKTFLALLVRYSRMTDKPDLARFMAAYRDSRNQLFAARVM